jgi:hypothetical protein
MIFLLFLTSVTWVRLRAVLKNDSHKFRSTAFSMSRCITLLYLMLIKIHISTPPATGPTAHIGPLPPLLRFRNSSFLWCEVVSPTPNPQPGGPGPRMYDPQRQGGPAIPPGAA